MKRVTLNLLLVAALVLGVVAPVFAQDGAPDSRMPQTDFPAGDYAGRECPLQ